MAAALSAAASASTAVLPAEEAPLTGKLAKIQGLNADITPAGLKGLIQGQLRRVEFLTSQLVLLECCGAELYFLFY